MTFCKHRWTIIKRWSEDSDFFVIQRCRYCDKWKRRKLRMALKGVKEEIISTTDWVKDIHQIEEPSQIGNAWSQTSEWEGKEEIRTDENREQNSLTPQNDIEPVKSQEIVDNANQELR